MCILRTHSFKWQWFWTSCCLLSSITSKLPAEEMGDWFEGHTFKEVFSDGHIHCRGETYCFHCLRAVVSCCMLWVLQECGYLELGRWGKQEISGLGIWAGFQKLLWKTVSSPPDEGHLPSEETWGVAFLKRFGGDTLSLDIYGVQSNRGQSDHLSHWFFSKICWTILWHIILGFHLRRTVKDCQYLLPATFFCNADIWVSHLRCRD